MQCPIWPRLDGTWGVFNGSWAVAGQKLPCLTVQSFGPLVFQLGGSPGLLKAATGSCCGSFPKGPCSCTADTWTLTRLGVCMYYIGTSTLWAFVSSSRIRFPCFCARQQLVPRGSNVVPCLAVSCFLLRGYII